MDSHTEKEMQEEMVEDTSVEVEDTESLEKETLEAMDAMKASMEEIEHRYLRLQADFDNFRKRTQLEKEQLSSYVKGEIIHQLLPVLDNLDRAFQTADIQSQENAFAEGIQMIHQNLLQTLEKQGLQEIQALGAEFDPNYHQAIMNAPSDTYEDNHISEVFQKGYTVDGRVIRVAMVKVVQN